jgi:hypothetical protein
MSARISKQVISKKAQAYTMVLKENDLFLTHSRNGKSAVAAFQPDIFISNTGTIEILRNRKSKVTGFNLIRQGIRKIKFDKIIGNYEY